MLFSSNFVHDINLLFKKIDTVVSTHEIKGCAEKLNKLFETPELTHLVNVTAQQQDACQLRLMELNRTIITELKRIEVMIREEATHPEVIYCLDMSKDDSQPEPSFFPTRKEAWLRVALEHHCKHTFEKPKSGLALLDFDNNIKIVVGEYLQTPSIIAWEETKREKDQITDVLRNLNLIKYRTSKTSSEKLKVAMQNVCNYFVLLINATQILKSRPIETIQFCFDDSSNIKKAYLVLSINEGTSIRFEGVRARNFYKLLVNRPKTISAERFDFTTTVATKNLSRKNDYLRKEFEEINRAIAKKWYPYGFVYGAVELIQSDGYDHNINCAFAHYISQI